MSILSPDFYQRPDVVLVAKELLGKHLYTKIDNVVTSGMIVETEAYAGPTDKASHAYGNRRTKRTEVMFEKGGVAYVYLCYGIHCLLNAVTHIDGVPHAVLIRAIRPIHGIDEMLKRRGKDKLDRTLTNGPGALCQALGITLAHNREPLSGPLLWIANEKELVVEGNIKIGPRIGIDYAEEDALLPWRFVLENCNSS